MTSPLSTLQVAAAAPWGEGRHEIPCILHDAPLFGEVSPAQMRKTRAPVRIKLDAGGGLHALPDPVRPANGAGAFIRHFDGHGKLAGRTPLPSRGLDADDPRILDHAADADGSHYLLEAIHPNSDRAANRLRCVSDAGEVKWVRTGPLSEDGLDFGELRGVFTRLLMDGGSRLYLPAAGEAGAMAGIDRTNGLAREIYRFDVFGGEVFMTERGVAVFVWYSAEANRRGLGFFDPAEDRLELMPGGVELFGWLLYPIGVDAASNLYAWKDAAVARIAPDGGVFVLAAFDNIVVRSTDEAIFSSRISSDGRQPPVVRVTRHSPPGRDTYRDLALPDRAAAGEEQWRLVHVDQLDRIYLFGGEEPGRAGTVLVYSDRGEREDVQLSPRDLLSIESRLQVRSSWQVDGRGRIYLPVTDPQGLKIVRLTAPDGG